MALWQSLCLTRELDVVRVGDGARDRCGLINNSPAMLAPNRLIRKAKLGSDVIQRKSTDYWHGHDLARRVNQHCMVIT
jgi:hypothetical protein